MKYIVPLFRQNTGRVNLGLVNWDSFQAGFRVLMRGDKFAGVTWDPWLRERKSGERRKGQQRTIPERRSNDEVEVIGANSRHATRWSASRPSSMSLGKVRSRMRAHVC